jgi:general secretion pathway protein I
MSAPKNALLGSRRRGSTPAARATRAWSRQGFTLLEVMVAVAILGLGLTAILTAQAGAFKSVGTARLTSEATGLARCRMSEIEWELTQNGFPLVDAIEQGPCCDTQLHPKLSCVWRIEKPEFPEASYGEMDLNADLDLGSSPGGAQSGSNSAGALTAMGALPAGGGLDLPQNGNVGDIASSVIGAGSGDMLDSVTSMMMGIVYPDLKAAFEAGSRRITVTVVWTEGNQERSLEISQWVTSARQAGLVGEIPTGEEADEEEASGTGRSTGSTGSGSTGSGRTNPMDAFRPQGARR